MANRRKIQEFIHTTLAHLRFVAVSNREPYVHSYMPSGEIRCSRPTSGMVSALDPVLQAGQGTWIASGSGTADFDVADRNGLVPVPPGDPKYLLKRVRLSAEQQEGYYDGFSNQALWPLCHLAHTRPDFDARHWRMYQQVNALFAEEVRRTIGDNRAFVFVQDYHLALLPRLIKQKCPKAIVAHFWHIPWPHPETLNLCPWQREIVRGLLGSDLLGFHLPQYCENFAAGARSLFPDLKKGPRHALTGWGRSTRVRPFPIGIDFEEFDSLAATPAVQQEAAEVRRRYRLPRWVGVGIDRLDYIKGIPERLKAVARFLERFPEFQGQFSFVQVAVPSRTELEPYQQLRQEVCSLAKQINRRFGKNGWKPVILIVENRSPAEVAALYQLADFCLVSSLHDGMNLVAKEFVAARRDHQGVLLLSQFAGAASQLRDSLLLNPHDTEGVATLIRKALLMDPSEQSERMRRMRASLRRRNIFRWMIDILAAASECDAAALGSSGEESWLAASSR